MSQEAPEDVGALRRRVAELEAAVADSRDALKAVHHQIKNHLQVISSLLHLQAAHVSDPAGRAALHRSEGRVRALALVHEGVSRSGDPGRIDLAPHLEGLCAQLARSHRADRVRLTVRAGAIDIDVDRAATCTLLVHELVSNALGHAFPDGRPGTVTVAAERGPGGRYAVSVADDGVGLPADLDPRQTRTLGLQLVTALAEQLGGTMSVDRAGGTTVRVALPDPGPAP